MEGKIVHLVGMNIPEETDEEAFNKWYNEQHVPEVVGACPGMLRGTRYEILDPEEGYPRFLAIYEIASPEAHEEFLAVNAKRRTGELPPYTVGPRYQVKWKKAYRRISP